jgi:transposase-like protein
MVAAAIRTIFAQPDATHVHEQLEAIAAMLGRQFPKVEVMLREAAPELLAFTAFPVAHWKKVWSTNPLERVNKSAWNGRLRSASLVGHPRRTAGGATIGRSRPHAQDRTGRPDPPGPGRSPRQHLGGDIAP